MPTIYQLSPTAYLTKCLVFGWTFVRGEDTYVISTMDKEELRIIRGLVSNNLLYQEVCAFIDECSEKIKLADKHLESGKRQEADALLKIQAQQVEESRFAQVRIKARQDKMKQLEDSMTVWFEGPTPIQEYEVKENNDWVYARVAKREQSYLLLERSGPVIGEYKSLNEVVSRIASRWW